MTKNSLISISCVLSIVLAVLVLGYGLIFPFWKMPDRLTYSGDNTVHDNSNSAKEYIVRKRAEIKKGDKIYSELLALLDKNRYGWGGCINTFAHYHYLSSKGISINISESDDYVIVNYKIFSLLGLQACKEVNGISALMKSMTESIPVQKFKIDDI